MTALDTKLGSIEILGPENLRDHYVTGLHMDEPDEVTIDCNVIYREKEPNPGVFIAVGTLPLSPADFTRWRELGIGEVVDLCRDIAEEAQRASTLGIDYFGTYVQDTNSPSQEQFELTTAWMRARLNEGKNIYIHCHSGVGRAPTMTTAFLVRAGMPLDEALLLLKRERGVNISPRQLLGLDGFKDSLGGAD